MAAAIPCTREGDIDMARLPKVSASQMKPAVLDSDALLALAIQLTGQQLGFQCLDETQFIKLGA
ncbi:hypothetical protein [Aeromonas sobria]|uniref:hypothetical protein n=1 Tax=Aeromonas sobria TaxID=646 RepID=UPI001396AF8F|nr:hypothetical protein [Aeromonas sobria]